MAPLSFPGFLQSHISRKEVLPVALKNVFSALLLSHDASSLYVARKVFEQYGIDVSTAQSGIELDELVRRRRYDLAVIDNEAFGAGNVGCLDPESKWSGISLVLRGKSGVEIQGKRVHLVVSKPLTPGVLAMGVKAAYTTMARNRLATYRHPVTLKLLYARLLQHGMQRPMDRATVLNVSQTGLCLSTSEVLPPGALVIGNLPMPESHESVNISGTIVWSHPSGRTGLRFQRLSPFEQKKLQEHLNPRLPWRVDFLLSE